MKLPWLQKLRPKLREEFKKIAIITVFTLGSNLNNLKNCFLKCLVIRLYYNVLYIGETKKKVVTRIIEHQQDSFNGKRDSSGGTTEHCLEFHGQFNWINPKPLTTKQQYHRRKIRESLEIKKEKMNKRRKVLNHHEGNLIKTITWTPFFTKLTGEKETSTKT